MRHPLFLQASHDTPMTRITCMTPAPQFANPAPETDCQAHDVVVSLAHHVGRCVAALLLPPEVRHLGVPPDTNALEAYVAIWTFIGEVHVAFP